MISKEVEFLRELLKIEEDCADTINTERPDFEGSLDEACYKAHQRDSIKLKQCIRKLAKYEQLLIEISVEKIA
jgi:hypothetical protein